MTRIAVDPLQRRIREAVAARRRTPADLQRELGGASREGRKAVRRALRDLVAAGELCFVLEAGRSWIEPSFELPLPVSSRIVLCPEGRGLAESFPGVVVRIAPGAAFGSGRHPSTRLALRGIDVALAPETGRQGPGSRVLDVGTGSGVLVIAAVQLGVASGLGIDRDPCARSEARANVRANGLEDRIRVSDLAVEDVEGSFSLVVANLRAPTLVAMAQALSRRCLAGGALVMSGIRPPEEEGLLGVYGRFGWRSLWRETEGGWAGLVLERAG